jgi:hypothetical protein
MTSSSDSDAGLVPPTLTVPSSTRRHASRLWVPLLLLILALLDLRTEILLLVDHLTLTSVLAAVRNHTLAVLVLLLQPSLWRRYR